ncbi:lysine N-methyltransferase EEF2KMT-like 1 [Homarus americanus]|uniref:Lysine N-methyltransferase EEF2KMT-like 1 n=1 Tax=Homarus americanus TaxID=6706 RepID=A0A8J5K6Q0_HOMAM|nr:lysine N-methyltransferase EEF2KMT-like 1 [Homarus americanus]
MRNGWRPSSGVAQQRCEVRPHSIMIDLDNRPGMLCYLLTRGHLAGVPLSRTLWSHVATALDAASIDESPQHLVSQLLMASLLHPLTAAAPRDPAHAREVLEWLREQCQARGWHLPPELIHEALSHPGEVLEVYYKTYVGWGGSAVGRVGVTLLESGSGITHNTTGLTTWYGAAVLADWATDNEVLAGRRVVELGAGVGFTASVILTSTAEGRPPPTTYLLTDCHHHVLTLLHHNLTLNLASPPPKRQDLEVFQREVSEELVKGEVEAGEVVSWPPGGATTTPVELI